MQVRLGYGLSTPKHIVASVCGPCLSWQPYFAPSLSGCLDHVCLWTTPVWTVSVWTLCVPCLSLSESSLCWTALGFVSGIRTLLVWTLSVWILSACLSVGRLSSNCCSTGSTFGSRKVRQMLSLKYVHVVISIHIYIHVCD